MLNLIPGNAQHIGARKEQQDSFGFSDTRDKALVANGGLLAVVADGMGGLEGGQQSSSIAVQAFIAAYARKALREPIPAALRRSLIEANRAVLAVARQAGTEGNTGTTFAAAVMHNDLLYWIATGDSRIYLLRDSQLVQVNVDHTYATTLWSAVASGRLERESALNDPQAPHLTSHLGMDEVEHIDLSERPYPLVDDDIVIVCSDGVYRALREQEIARIFRSAASSSAACEAVKAGVLAKGSAKQDNLTILAVQCHDPDPAPAQPVPAALSRATSKSPSNLGLISVTSLELLMAVSLGVWYLRGNTTPTHQGQSTRPAVPAQAAPAAGLPDVQTGKALENGSGTKASGVPVNTPGGESATPSAQKIKPVPKSEGQTPPQGNAAPQPRGSKSSEAPIPAAANPDPAILSSPESMHATPDPKATDDPLIPKTKPQSSQEQIRPTRKNSSQRRTR